MLFHCGHSHQQIKYTRSIRVTVSDYSNFYKFIQECNIDVLLQLRPVLPVMRNNRVQIIDEFKAYVSV
jgi:hypothetical protein